MQNQQIVLLCITVVLLAVLAAFAYAFVSLFRLWLQCFMSGTPTPFVKLLGMRLRRSPIRKICEQRIKAGYAGVDLPVEPLEQAHQQGADIEKLVDALCVARREDSPLTWDDLLQTELPSRHGESERRVM